MHNFHVGGKFCCVSRLAGAAFALFNSDKESTNKFTVIGETKAGVGGGAGTANSSGSSATLTGVGIPIPITGAEVGFSKRYTNPKDTLSTSPLLPTASLIR